jgi:hypothetical protein
VLTKIKRGSLVVCLFLFLFVVIGGGLHLNPGGALLAAATGTPLVIHVFNRRWGGSGVEHDPPLHQGVLVLCAALPRRMPAILVPPRLKPSSDSEPFRWMSSGKRQRRLKVSGCESERGSL